jgi:ABC-type Mn2+/Zn2+ transport system ATPase subunit
MTVQLVEIEDLKLHSPAGAILQNFSTTVEEGEILFLRGPNGTGKSTFLRELFSVLERQTNNPSIRLGNLRSFAYLPQSLNREFFVPLSLGEVAGLSWTAGGRPPKAEILRALLPDAIVSRLWNVASGGEKQRAVLAQTLSNSHSLYLLDEPFNHLDQASIDTVAKIIKSLASGGAAFLIATHTVPEGLNIPTVKTLSFRSREDP